MPCDDASRMNMHTRFGIELRCSEQTSETGMYRTTSDQLRIEEEANKEPRRTSCPSTANSASDMFMPTTITPSMGENSPGRSWLMSLSQR